MSAGVSREASKPKNTHNPQLGRYLLPRGEFPVPFNQPTNQPPPPLTTPFKRKSMRGFYDAKTRGSYGEGESIKA